MRMSSGDLARDFHLGGMRPYRHSLPALVREVPGRRLVLISLAVAYYTVRAPLSVHESEVRTATQAKKLIGLRSDAWLYVRLPRHERAKNCACYYCSVKPKKGGIDIFSRPPWVSQSEEWTPQPWPWVRADIGHTNARLNLPDGAYVLGVALNDMPQFSLELQTRGRYGMIHALAWVQSEDRKKLEESLAA